MSKGMSNGMSNGISNGMSNGKNPVSKPLVKAEKEGKEAKEDRATIAVAWEISLVTLPLLRNHAPLKN